MAMLLQWVIVALIGVVAVWTIARHFGLGVKKAGAGCPGGNACEKPKAKHVGAKHASP